MRSLAAPLLISLLAVSGCSVAPQDIAREPHLTPIGSGLQTSKIPNVQRVSVQQMQPRANSTWVDSGADLFRDARAVRVGDVVTVKIQIKDKAQFDNNTSRSRDSKRGTGGDLKYAIAAFGVNKAGDATVDANVNGTTSTEGKGAIQRSESIDLLVAAVVTEVLPNGNLIISGSQEVRVNFEVRVLNVSGIVRPRDISTDNSVSYDRIAEARISYGGRGRLMEVQQPAWGQQVIDVIAPF
jgi:flagellar L-ring protein precursor FlgH